MLKSKVSKEQYESLSDDLKSEYKADGDSFVIQVEGMKTQADIDAIKGSKENIIAEKKELEAKLKEAEKSLGELTDKVKVYEADGDLKFDKERLVEFERIKRENETLLAEKADIEGKYGSLEKEVTLGKIKSELANAAVGIIEQSAINDQIEILANKFVVSDGKVLTNSDLGDKSGLEAKAYLSHYVESRSYLTPKNSGGGAGGGQGSGGGSQTAPKTTGVTISQEIWGETKATG